MVRQVRARAELAPVRTLIEAHVRYEQSAAVVPEDWEGRLADLIAVGRLTVFIASSDDTVLGYASMTREVSTWSGRTFAHLDCLFVDGENRGHGVGRLLFNAASAHARSVGETELQWQTPAWNEGAIPFYSRTGAQSASKARFTLPIEPTAEHYPDSRWSRWPISERKPTSLAATTTASG